MRQPAKTPATGTPLVVIVDDDQGMREAIRDVLRSVDIEALEFSSTADLLAAKLPDRPGCMILDVRLPGSSGLDLQQRLKEIGIAMPIIFVTGFGDIPMSVRAMKAGAVDFLTKPFRDQEILDAVTTAIAADRQQRANAAMAIEVNRLAQSLTPRENEVMAAVVTGLLNKQIAFQLGVSEITVKMHRGNVMRKMGARSVPELVLLYQKISK